MQTGVYDSCNCQNINFNLSQVFVDIQVILKFLLAMKLISYVHIGKPYKSLYSNVYGLYENVYRKGANDKYYTTVIRT